MGIELLNTDYEKVSYLLNLLVARATGLSADSNEFEQLRRELLNNQMLADQLPQWLKQHRTLDSFWGFIKPKFGTYAERRTYLSEQFTPILDRLEFGEMSFSEQPSVHQSDWTAPATRNKRKVFIVHGRDNEAKHEVGRFIEGLGL